MSEIPQLWVHEQGDGVGVVFFVEQKTGYDMLVCVTHDNSTFRLTSEQAAPIGHKIALQDMTKGDTVFKYGEDIGVMIDDVKKGHHLHTHNCKTKRW